MNSRDIYWLYKISKVNPTFQLFGCFWILSILFGTACAQGSLKEITSKDELSIKFQHVAKLGETKKYLIPLGRIPNAPPVPNGYKLFEDKSYFLKTETVELGFPTVSFKISTNSEPIFRNIRILQLVADDFSASGYEWRVCTISEDNVWHFPRYTKEESAATLPNFAAKTINCELEGLKPEEFFAVVVQLQTPPTKTAFTDLTATMEGRERKPLAGDVSYDVILTNTGQKKIGELNIRSEFNTNLTSFKPERGTCKRVQYGFGGGTAVCFLGELPPGGKVKVHFDVSILPQEALPPNNLYWTVTALIKESPLDPIWPANMFLFEPLLGKKSVNGM